MYSLFHSLGEVLSWPAFSAACVPPGVVRKLIFQKNGLASSSEV